MNVRRRIKNQQARSIYRYQHKGFNAWLRDVAVDLVAVVSILTETFQEMANKRAGK